MVILGIDPGTRRIGYGLIKKRAGSLKFLDAGILKIKSGDDFGALLETKSHLSALIKKWRPRIAAVEKLYFAKNQKTGIAVAEARGAIILTLIENGLKIKEFSPNEMKANITGYGFADKEAVLKMVKIILRQPGLKIIDDASDALGLAIMGSQKAI